MSHRPVPFLRTRKTLFLSFFPRMERTKDPRGPAPRSASTPVACPRTPLRGTPPWGRSSHPARAVQSIAPASPPLPLAGQSKKTVRLDGKTRLVPAAVEAGADTTGGWYPPLPPTRQPLRRGRCPHRPAVNCPAKQHGTGQAAPVGAAGPILRHARAQWPGRRGTRHSNFARRTGFPAKGAAKNGVLVPLPPWAKEPAAGAAESSFCGRMRTSAPTEKPAAENIKKRERPERPLPCFVFRTGAEAKRSFAGNSFAYFSFQEK